MKIIGVTGGVGSGKSTVLQILKEEFGARILVADEIGKKLQAPGGACYEAVCSLFGTAAVRKDGELDRAKIAQLVFQDQVLLRKLNDIVHPAVRKEIEESLRRYRLAGCGLSVVESAILIETGYEEICDEIWYVHVERELRIKRLQESRGYSREKCLAIMEHQMTEAEFKEKAFAVIENGGGVTDTKEQIATLLSL